MPTRRSRAVVVLTALLALGVVAVSTGGAQAKSPDQQTAATMPVASSTSSTAAPLTSDSALGLQDRPNIVVMMADDMRADDVQYMPNVQRLIRAEGVDFTNAFSPHPLCCPARASFVTGQYTHNHHVWSNNHPYGFAALDDTRTVATGLDDVGYNTAFLGKYLNGYGSDPAPDGSAPDSLAYVPPGWKEWRGSVGGPPGWDDPDAGGTYRYWDTTLNVDGVLQGNQGIYQTRLLGTQAADLVAEYAPSPKPFFLWTSYVAPHIGTPPEKDDPEPVTRENGFTNNFATPARPRWVRDMYDSVITEAPGAGGEADVSDKPFYIRDMPQANATERAAMLELTRQRAESLFVLDQEVGRTVDALEASGELDNTIVVFMSDNGYFLGEHRMRQGKILPYEPSLRVPTLMRGPGIPAGETRSDPIMTIDLAPTFLDAAGAQPDRAMDGVSMLDVARDGDRGWSRAVLTETGPLPAPLLGQARAPEAFLSEPSGPSRQRFSQGVRTSRYLYVEHASNERELYDLRSDPGQLHSIVDRPGAAHVVAELARVLDRMRECAGEQCATPLPADLQSR